MRKDETPALPEPIGEPLRPGEKTRPLSETTLADFPNLSPFMRILAWIRRQLRAVQGAI